MERGDNFFLSDVMLDPDIDTSSVPWSDLSLSPTEDALFADVYLGMDEDALNVCTFSTDPNTFNLDSTFVHENSFIDTSFTSWDFLTMQPPPTTNPSTATFASPDNGESSECIETQASLPRLQTHVSSDMLSPQTHEVPPTQSAPERPANVGNTPKRTKMKHGTRPCDLKSEKWTSQRNVTSAKRGISGGVIWKDTTALTIRMRLLTWDFPCPGQYADTAAKILRGVII
ncbi:hypothetical protein FCULG_00004780 [Fusarium culmorum]|uniref:Uncharacterized protein n=1 Tax=Fusarium culmorum TaxID=5516 RepID=A0A2T4H892_FUSCU|nr:hypothetical protein FCULG_00004780 [Fusarium culmorum]